MSAIETRTVRATQLSGLDRVIHNGEPAQVIARQNQYDNYDITHGWYLGAKTKNGLHPGRVPGTHYTAVGPCSSVSVTLAGNGKGIDDVLVVQPDHLFEVVR